MNAGRFDDLLRSCSESATRRGVSRVLTGLALAGPLSALLAPTGSDAKKKRNK